MFECTTFVRSQFTHMIAYIILIVAAMPSGTNILLVV